LKKSDNDKTGHFYVAKNRTFSFCFDKSKKRLDMLTFVVYINDRCRKRRKQEEIMTKRRLRKLSPANLEIMKIVWDRGEVSVSDVMEAVNAKRKKSIRRTTVQVQMNRLENYGWLKHREEGRSYLYSAAAEKHKTRREILEDIKNRVFGGSRAELVQCLLEDSDVTAEEIRELRSLLKKRQEEQP
jgi:BlaI family transcriptional regulator, penicillinase repressor